MSRIELAKNLFNSGAITTNANAPQNVPNKPGITDIQNSTSVRYGTVVKVEANSMYEIQLAGSESTIKAYCETKLKVGQGVKLVIQNGSYIVYGLSNQFNEIDDKFTQRIEAENQLAQEIESKGQAIIEQANKDLANATTTLNSRIDKTDASIATEVSKRQEAVNGAVAESKAYTDTKATEIQSTVEKNVTDSLGNKFATKSEITQTAEGLKVELNQSITEVKTQASQAKTDAANANANATQAKNNASTANTNANQAKADAANAKQQASDAAKTATNFLTYTSSGLEIGNKNLDASVLVKPTAIQFKNGTNVLAEYGHNYATIGQDTSSKLQLTTNGVTFSDRGKNFMSFTPNYGACTVETMNGSQLYLLGDRGIVLNDGTGGPTTQMHNSNPVQLFEQNPSIANNVTNLYGAVTLYRSLPSDGNRGTITLKRSVDNYVFLDIVFRDDGSNRRYWCQRIYNPSAYYNGVHHYGVHTALHGTVTNGSATYTFSSMCEITRTQIVRGITYQANVETTNNCGGRNVDIYITHVIGWR